MAIGRFFITTQDVAGTILDGPLAWDPDVSFNPLGPDAAVPLEPVSLALTQTYGGTRDATVYRDPANTAAQLMRESDALDCGWSYPPPPETPQE